MDLSAAEIILFFLTAIVAGCVDAIAGGGGLITIPVMLAAGVPPAAAVATNKLGGVAGTFSATLHFVRMGQIDLVTMPFMVVTTFLGALLGSLTLTLIDSAFLATIVPALLIGFSVYFLFSPNIGALDQRQAISAFLFALSFAPLIGFYDGFFGPGTGTFFCISLTLLLGFNLIKATANAKLLNFSSNLAALLLFVHEGTILWEIGFPLLFGQFIGGYLGARVALQHGRLLIKIIMTTMAIAVSIKLILGVGEN